MITKIKINICSNCNAEVNCKSDSISDCFCNSYPAVLTAIEHDSCLCNNCLHTAVSLKIKEICTLFSATDATEKNWMKDLPKSKNIIEGIDYYTDNGFFVFTKWHHLKRGYCCKNNCRHCAYGYQKK
jgi:Family of unknown function (DUF5522)